jgi:hypothetical protein
MLLYKYKIASKEQAIKIRKLPSNFISVLKIKIGYT